MVMLSNKLSWDPDLLLFSTTPEVHLVHVAYLATLATQITMQL